MGRLTGLPSAVITDDSALGGAVLEKSLRFNSTDSAKLSKTFSSDGNLRTFTFSSWCKLSSITTNSRSIFSGSKSGVGFFKFQFRDDDRFEVNTAEGSDSTQLITTAKFRDTNAWYHVVVAFDSTQSTSTDRCKLYINGTLITAYDIGTYPPQNRQTTVGSAGEHNIGNQVGTSRYFDGYMAEVNFIDGIQLDPSHFGYTEFQTGIWRPKGYFGSYNANGFRLDFSDNSAATATTLGKDRSGQGNDFTPNNISVSTGVGNDSFDVSPTKQSFASYEPNDSVVDAGSGKSYRQGGYTLYNTGAIHAAGRSSFPVNSGKWYAEFKLTTYSSRSGSTPYVGAARVEWMYEDFNNWIGSIGTAMNASGSTYRNGSSFSGGGVSYTAGDIISVAIDLDNGKQIWWAKNGTYINSGNPATTTGGHNIDPLSQSGYYQFGTSGWASTSEWEANFGQRPFSYSIPAGFKTLQVDNLPDRTQSIIKPQKHFDTILYTGDNTEYRKIPLGFKADLLWFKQRNGAASHVLSDSVTGITKHLTPNSTATQSSPGYPYVSSVEDDGIILRGSASSGGNVNGRNMVAWCWKAGGTAVTNNDGNNTSQVSVNAEAGFSILTYTGNGTNNSNITMGHGLGKTPAFVIIKNRSSTIEWVTWIRGIGGSADNNQKNLSLNSTANAGQNSDQFRVADATTIQVRSTDSTNGKVNKNGNNYVAYCWAEIPGYSKMGIYRANGNGDGTFQFTGFRPAFVILKRFTDGSNYWELRDNKRDPDNPANSRLFSNTTDSESVGEGIDFLSNGFKLRNTGSGSNANNKDFAYVAFAEQPQFTPYDTQPNAR